MQGAAAPYILERDPKGARGRQTLKGLTFKGGGWAW